MQLLQNLKILDFTRLLPGPLATHMMAQMGAKIIKIEHPKRIDYARLSGKQVDGQSMLFRMLNHNKEMQTIAYDTEEGMKTMKELIENSDALIEQFRPGAMNSWRLGYEDVKKINPNIVYVSLTGYGQDGPLKLEPGHDLNYLANAGILSLLKDENGKPIVPGFQLADIGGGSYMTVMACLTGLVGRATKGEGCHIDVSMTDALFPLLTVPMSMQWAGWDHRVMNILNGKALVNYAVYECADGKYISVGALEPKFWNNICEALGQESWKRKHEMELVSHVFPKAEVEALFKTKSRDDWTSFFKGKDVCIAPVLELEELEIHEQHNARKAFETFETEKGKVLKTVALPFREV